MNRKNLLAGVFSAALFLGVASSACARPPHPEAPLDARPPHERVAQKMHHDLSERLKLTDEQKKQAEEIRKSGRKELKPLMKEMKQLRQKMDAARKTNMEEFEKILTPEQKAELDRFKAEKKAEFELRRHKKGKRPLPPKPEAESKAE